jgi:PAS domain S-box-containing protein
LVYIFHPIPEIKKDLTPIGVALCAMAFFVGIFRHRFLDLNPTPRSRLFDAFRDVVVVIDGRKNIIDINRAAMSILGLAEADVGSSIHRCTLLAPVFNRLEGEVEGDVDISTGTGEGACHFEAHVDLLHKHDAVRKGAVIVLHDVTERVRMSEEIKTLRGILPICARCKKIRDDEGFWQSVEAYVSKRSYAEFSHSLCPDCLREFYSELGDKQGAAGD